MDYLPIFLNLKGKTCAVVGGGEVAARKISLLLKAYSQVKVIAPQIESVLEKLKEEGKVDHVKDRFVGKYLTGCSLVIAATNDQAVNKSVHDSALKLNIPVNVVDDPSLCTFIMPSIVDRSPLIAAVSTGGASPVLARLVRARMESLIPASYGKLAKLISTFRSKVKDTIKIPRQRRLFWEKVLQGHIAELVFCGREKDARVAIQEELDSLALGNGAKKGEVYLVGGGPGDPDLLTFRALRLLQQADVVVHDRLVSPRIVDMARRDAKRIYVGKERDKHALPQEDINNLLVRLAKEGNKVVRLKGGDPFIFGRGGEELETLVSESIPFQVVPGITAASGCAAYAGIPLTHRDFAQSCVFITGHLKDGTTNLDWDALVQPRQTIVFYMGLAGLDRLCAELMKHGMSETMPAALVQQGTTHFQRVYVGDLKSLPDIVAKENVKAPTLVIVGEVVQLRNKLDWFDPGLASDASWGVDSKMGGGLEKTLPS
ncbi:MAG: uroporphyrinogen-III C-methyltransferase [Gammaproteobacteria bacterium]|nr:uroporphyrinogen-III C-methyltransferase [Gammaproteobacteria bacterium]